MSAQELPPAAGPDLRAVPVEGATREPRTLDALLDVSMPVTVEIGRTRCTLEDVLQLGPGSVMTLDRSVGEPVDVFVGDRRLAEGEIVVVDDRLAVRVLRIVREGSGAEA